MAAGAVLAMVTILAGAPAGADTAASRRTKPARRACALLTRSEITPVLGADPGRGRRDGRLCRYAALPDGTVLITALFRGAGTDELDDARRISESLGGQVEQVPGIGEAAIWEPEKGQLSVATPRGNIFEVQVIAPGNPALAREDALDLAQVVLAARRA